MINGVIFKLKPYETEDSKIWLLGVDIPNGQIEENAIPLSDNNDRYENLDYCHMMLVNFQVTAVPESDKVEIDIKDLAELEVKKESGFVPIFVAMQENAFIPLIKSIIRQIREGGSYGQG